MATSLYQNFANLMMGDAGAAHTLPDLSAPANNGIKIHLLDEADHTVNLATDVDEADITDLGIVATSTALDNPTVSAGVWDADDEVISSVTGDEFESLVFWHDTTTDTTSPLILNNDDATGLPVTPNGGDITVAFNASGILTLV